MATTKAKAAESNIDESNEQQVTSQFLLDLKTLSEKHNRGLQTVAISPSGTVVPIEDMIDLPTSQWRIDVLPTIKG